MSVERINLIKSFGAKIILVSPEEGGFLGSIRKTEELARRESNIFLPCQFSNEANIEAHFETTGPELWYQLQSLGKVPNAFVAGVGTGGTVMGVGRFLRSQIKALEFILLNLPSLQQCPPGTKSGNIGSREYPTNSFQRL